MRRLRTGLLLIPLLGCHAETFGDNDLPIDPQALQVVSGQRLPGGTIVVTASWLAGAPDSLRLTIDDSIGVTAVRGDSLARFGLVLPTTLAAGTHELKIQLGGTPASIGLVRTGGLVGFRGVTGDFFGPVQPAPALVALVGESEGRVTPCSLAVLFPRDGTIRTVAPISVCGYGPGVSYRLSTFLTYLERPSGYWSRIGIGPTTTTSDTLAVWGTHWPRHELAPGLYLQDFKQQTYLESTAPAWTEVLSNGSYVRPGRIAFSPDARWAVSSHDQSVDGLLIVDRTARAYHWSPGWRSFSRPLFLPDDRLVVYGWRAGTNSGSYGAVGSYAEYLAHVDPASGTLVDSVRFGDPGSPYDLPTVLDTAGLIAIAGRFGDHLEVTVRDPSTLLEVGHIATPPTSTSCTQSSLFPVVTDPSLHRFYVVGDACPGAVPIWTFQLPD